MKIHLASDHAGFELKEELKGFLMELRHEVEDHGAHAFNPEDDYPPFVRAAAARVCDSKGVERAIVIGASGQGEAMVANRFPGVRAAVYYGAHGEQLDQGGKSLDMVRSLREHNDANMLSLGARFLTVEEAKTAVETWLATPFSGEERHRRRITLIDHHA